MRILITGISGFAGRHLAARMLGDGHEVHGTVHQRSSGASLLGWMGDEHRLSSDALTAVDVCDVPALNDMLRRIRPDAIYHLAGTATVGHSALDPAAIFTINALGTLNLLSAVRAQCASARVVTVGSASAYGLVDADRIPVTEDAPFRPLSPYGVSKAAADLIAHQWARAYDLDIVRVRPFNHIGPGQGLGFICPDVAQQLVAIERGTAAPVIEVGNVDVVRDFTDVRDVVDGYVAACDHGASGDVYNICSGLGHAVRSIVERLVDISGVSARLEIAGERVRQADIPTVVGSATKLRRIAGWKPHIPLERSLADVLADWRGRAA